jgi:hypothetical protein
VTRIVGINDRRATPVDSSAPEGKITVQCCICNRMGATLADLDGPAFKAYYHSECLPADNCTWDGKPIDQGD